MSTMRVTKLLLTTIIISLLTLSTAEAATSDKWQIEATNRENYTGAPVANGVIGILPWKEPFSVRHVIMNHVFDHDRESGVMKVLKGINPFELTMRVDGEVVKEGNVTEWQQTIDMRQATHNTRFKAPKGVEVTYTVAALRNLPHAGLISVRLRAEQDVRIEIENTIDIPTEYGDQKQTIKQMLLKGVETEVFSASASSPTGLQGLSATSLFIDPDSRFTVSTRENEAVVLGVELKKGESIELSLVGTVGSTRDFADPYSEMERQAIYAQLEGVESLMEGHQRMWNELWQGDIVIEGDDFAQQMARSSLYYLYSFCRAGTNLSISPMGLSSQGYSGHIFWDSEIWMFPPLLLFNAPIAESMINYRVERVAAAEKRALIHGYKGAMFPWESDDWGEESTPTFAITGQLEHHITADIAIAAWHYYCITKDEQWLRERGYPMMEKIAQFWVSRVTQNNDKSYSIVNVVGADEYAEGVTDNAFTNGAVIRALQHTQSAAELLGKTAPTIWGEIADGLLIHKFENGVTREYKGYNGETIKQADVNLLAYPLGLVTDPEQIGRDLAYYREKIDSIDGPAMGYSILAIQYARLGDADNAHQMFLRCYEPNLREPFGVLSETPRSQNPYFATGAGSLLQAIINGFGGLEVTAEGVMQRESVLPKHWKRLTIKGVGRERETFVVTQK